MEIRRYLWLELYWAAATVQLAMISTTATDVTTIPPQVETEEPTLGRHAWGSWGSWSVCSRSCGGGVAVQQRQCLPRTRSIIPEGTLPPPVITVRVTRQVQEEDCPGVARRYHECNTAPCPGGATDVRAEQCEAYDRRPFRGRFYTWVPYIDGESPCTLNCRPLGQQFYASLALVADGTPCTRPGFRAICVQGSCKVREIFYIYSLLFRGLSSEVETVNQKVQRKIIRCGNVRVFRKTYFYQTANVDL